MVRISRWLGHCQDVLNSIITLDNFLFRNYLCLSSSRTRQTPTTGGSSYLSPGDDNTSLGISFVQNLARKWEKGGDIIRTNLDHIQWIDNDSRKEGSTGSRYASLYYVGGIIGGVQRRKRIISI